MNGNNDSNETQISIHIFSVSAGLVGVCLTVIGIFRAIGELKHFSSLGDNILAIDALIFLGSCIFAYSSLRSKNNKKRRKLEKIADILFIFGLSLMAIVCTIIAYTFI
ncbi:MAG TPA: hypothetical protein PKY59_26875 [Pyrinomonadaceae bacterium]|nr:hypothetical protein [Pyrinomonadaceae bacterium]